MHVRSTFERSCTAPDLSASTDSRVLHMRSARRSPRTPPLTSSICISTAPSNLGLCSDGVACTSRLAKQNSRALTEVREVRYALPLCALAALREPTS